MKVFFKECPLLTNHPEIVHILHTNHHCIFRNCKFLPVWDKKEASFLRIYHKWIFVKKTLNRFITVYRKSRTGTDHNKFGVSCLRSHCGTGIWSIYFEKAITLILIYKKSFQRLSITGTIWFSWATWYNQQQTFCQQLIKQLTVQPRPGNQFTG